MTAPRCWVNVITRDHVLGGVRGGFTQADHGRPTRLAKLRRGDRMVFYSPRAEFDKKIPLQAFTAIGSVQDDEPYQATISPDFMPWRRKMRFEKELREASIRPLLEGLSFIPDAGNWGLVFRRGMFEIPCDDLEIIASAMQAR